MIRQRGERIVLATTGVARQSSSKPRPRLRCSRASTGSKTAPEPARVVVRERLRGVQTAAVGPGAEHPSKLPHRACLRGYGLQLFNPLRRRRSVLSKRLSAHVRLKPPNVSKFRYV